MIVTMSWPDLSITQWHNDNEWEVDHYIIKKFDKVQADRKNNKEEEELNRHF